MTEEEFVAYEARARDPMPVRVLSQEGWGDSDSQDLEWNVEDEGEATNEDGGDILDEPHDDDCDLEEDYRDFPSDLPDVDLRNGALPW